jgi:cytochrome c553
VHVDNAANPVVDPDTGLPLAAYSKDNSYTDDGHNFAYDSGGNYDPVNPVGSVGGPYTEPDYIQFCLTCHDDDGTGNMLPAGVTMSPGMIDIASEYVSQDQHGGGEGNTGSKTSKGGLKAPYVNAADDAANNDPPNNYAAMNCSDCHGAHGTGSIFNLRESITIGGVVLTVGGGGGVNPGVLDEPHYNGSSTYKLPLIGGVQTDHYWGAWCTFCHKMDGHPDKIETEACTNGHMHGGGSF